MVQAQKSCSCRHFSKYLPNNFRTLSNHHKNYAKTFFCSRILHSYFQSHSFRLPSSNEANCKIGILLTGIWIPSRTCLVEVWLNKSATWYLLQSFDRNLFFQHKNFNLEVIFVHTCTDVNSRVRHTSQTHPRKSPLSINFDLLLDHYLIGSVRQLRKIVKVLNF